MAEPNSDLPAVIPPRSVFRLARFDADTPEWELSVGRTFRIGYYNQQDGLDTIWLVNTAGKYEQTTDREFLLKYFDLLVLSDETDPFGLGKPPLGPTGG